MQRKGEHSKSSSSITDDLMSICDESFVGALNLTQPLINSTIMNSSGEMSLTQPLNNYTMMYSTGDNNLTQPLSNCTFTSTEPLPSNSSSGSKYNLKFNKSKQPLRPSVNPSRVHNLPTFPHPHRNAEKFKACQLPTRNNIFLGTKSKRKLQKNCISAERNELKGDMGPSVLIPKLPRSMSRKVSKQHRRSHNMSVGEKAENNQTLERLEEETNLSDTSIQLDPIKRKKKTDKSIILDLDETLIHTFEDEEYDEYDLMGKCRFKTTIYRTEGGKEWIYLRPGLRDFLAYVRINFECILFTAAGDIYAQRMLDIIDPHKHYFDHILHRDHCNTHKKGGFLTYSKGLRRLNRDPAKCIVIDDISANWGKDIHNLLPIKPFLGDKLDRELPRLANMLYKLRYVKDVREATQMNAKKLYIEQKKCEDLHQAKRQYQC